MKKKLRLAIAGLGLVGERHATAIAASGEAELVAVIDPNDACMEFVTQNGLARYKGLEAAFENEQFDGIILATPTPLHVAQSMECIARGCPILIEKPIATSSQDAESMAKLAHASDVPILVGHHRRHNPIIQSAKALLEEDRIGDIRAVHANCWFYKPDEYFEKAPWRKQKGAGPISVNLVHDVDLIRYFCGEVASVQAQLCSSRRGYENEDVAAAVLRFESGAIGTISVSDAIVSPWSWELTSGEYPIYPKTQESSYHIGGSKGSMSVPDLKIWSHEQRPDWWSPIGAQQINPDKSDPLINQIVHFCAVIQREVEPLVSAAEGIKTLRVIEAIQKAAESEETIRL